MQGTKHNGQTDYAMVSSWELCALGGETPKFYFHTVYQLHAWKMLQFLNKLHYNDQAYSKGKLQPYFDASTVCEKVSEMEKEWIKYDMQFGDM